MIHWELLGDIRPILAIGGLLLIGSIAFMLWRRRQEQAERALRQEIRRGERARQWFWDFLMLRSRHLRLTDQRDPHKPD